MTLSPIETPMKTILALAVLLAAAGCARHDDWCPSFAASVNLSDYVDQRTGRIVVDQTGHVIDPETGDPALNAEQVACIRREAENAVNALQAGR